MCIKCKIYYYHENFEHATCVTKLHVPLYRLHKTYFWILKTCVRNQAMPSFSSTFRRCTRCSFLCSGYRVNLFHVVEMFWISFRTRLFTEYVKKLEESFLTKTVLDKYLQRRRGDGRCVTFSLAGASLWRLKGSSGARSVCQKRLTSECDEGDDMHHWHEVKGSQHHSEQFPLMSLSQVPSAR